MLDAMRIILERSFYDRYNGIIFYLQKMPLIKRIVSDKFYKVDFIKKISIFLGIINKILSSIFGKIIYYTVIWFSLSRIFKIFELKLSKEYMLSFMMVLSIVGFLKTVDYFRAEKEDYLLVKIMGLRPKFYYIAKIFYLIIFDIFAYTLVFGIIFSEISITFKDVFAYSCFLFGLRVFAILHSTRMYKKDLKKRETIGWVVPIALFLLLLLYLVYSIVNLLNNNKLFWQKEFYYNSDIFFIIGISVLAIAFYLLFKSKRLEEHCRTNLRRSTFDVDIEEIVTFDLKLDEKGFDKNIVTNEFENYSGIEYINRIFFSRFKKQFFKPIRNRLIIVFLAIVAINFFVYRLDLYKDLEAYEFFSSAGSLIAFAAGFLIYIGDKFTRLCFYNMDKFLMRNNFYRRDELLSQAIKIRFKKMVLYNLPMFLVLELGMNLVLIQMKTSFYANILMIVFGFLGLVFFNFHYLYSYYLLQPFTEQMEIKNPVYSILNILAYYIIIAMFYFYKKFGDILLIALFIFIVLYILVGYLLVKKYAYKRFKIR